MHRKMVLVLRIYNNIMGLSDCLYLSEQLSTWGGGKSLKVHVVREQTLIEIYTKMNSMYYLISLLPHF